MHTACNLIKAIPSPQFKSLTLVLAEWDYNQVKAALQRHGRLEGVRLILAEEAFSTEEEMKVDERRLREELGIPELKLEEKDW
ncbi:hypothetical protein HDV00_007243 [Rhizophlyctis rosea]|nr:hypothetical protein HDV00_007243 [Rhizophlyctis rosea]